MKQTCMPRVEFEPTIPASERQNTHALDRAINEIGLSGILSIQNTVRDSVLQRSCAIFEMLALQLCTKGGLGMRIYNVRKPTVRNSKTACSLFEGVSEFNIPNHRNLSKFLQRSDCTYDTLSSLLPTIKPFENTPSGVKQPPPSTLYKTISPHHCALCRWSRYAVRRGYKLLYVCMFLYLIRVTLPVVIKEKFEF